MNCPECHVEAKECPNNIYKCPLCGLYMTKGNFEYKVDAQAEEHLMDSLEALRRDNYRTILKKIIPLLPEHAKGMDIGCARGWFLEEAKKNGLSVEGIEPTDTFCISARERGFHVDHGLFPQDIKECTGPYDFIIFNDVLEHIPNLEETLKKSWDYLTPGGYLIVNCPDSNGVLFKIANVLAKIGIDGYWRRLWQMDFYSPHLWYFNHKNLDKVISKFGWIVQDTIFLKTISAYGLKERVLCNNRESHIIGYMTYAILRMSLPIIKLLPGDIMCHVYRKS